MRFVSDDGSFGFRLTPADDPTYDSRFFTFQLVFGSRLLGDEEPSIAGSCFGPLGSIEELRDPRLWPGAMTESELDELLVADDALNDATLRHLAESMDGLTTRLYEVGGRVHVNVREDGSGVSSRTSLPRSEFDSIVEAVRLYWRASGG